MSDLNGDGRPDVIVGFQHPSGNSPDFVQILINMGNGTFRDETASRIQQPGASHYGLRQLYLLPANNRGRRVLLMVRVGQAPVLKTDWGDGVFLDSPSWSPADYPWSVIGADFNGDGWLDFAFGPDGTSPVRMQFGQSAIVPDCATEAGLSPLQACTAVSLLDAIHGSALGPVQHSQPKTRGH